MPSRSWAGYLPQHVYRWRGRVSVPGRLPPFYSLVRSGLDRPSPPLPRAVDITETALGPDHPTMATRRGNLGRLLQALGDLPGAHSQLEQALAIGERALSPNHPSVVDLGTSLADMSKTVDGRRKAM
jgi:hypothetical protein